jgi:hypothetical protein
LFIRRHNWCFVILIISVLISFSQALVIAVCVVILLSFTDASLRYKLASAQAEPKSSRSIPLHSLLRDIVVTPFSIYI